MAEVNQVNVPQSFSLYERPDKSNIGLFGDDHEYQYGQEDPNPLDDSIEEQHRSARVQSSHDVTSYIESIAEQDPNLHVYVEAAPHVIERGVHHRANPHMLTTLGLEDLFPGRIHNIDRRHGRAVIPDRIYKKQNKTKQDFDDVVGLVRRYVQTRYPAYVPMFEEVKREAELEFEAGDDEQIEWSYERLMDAAIEADVLRTIDNNPDNARDMLFYIGNGHKRRVDRFLNTHPTIRNLYRRDALHNDPIAVSRFLSLYRDPTLP
jgi:hypothetical protein